MLACCDKKSRLIFNASIHASTAEKAAHLLAGQCSRQRQALAVPRHGQQVLTRVLSALPLCLLLLLHCCRPWPFDLLCSLSLTSHTVHWAECSCTMYRASPSCCPMCLAASLTTTECWYVMLLMKRRVIEAAGVVAG